MYKVGGSTGDRSNSSKDSKSGAQRLSPLNFYEQPPLFDVTIEEFETCALDRLRILAEVEACSARAKSWEETSTILSRLCNEYMPLSVSGRDFEEQYRKDQLSHFVLRLAFCRSHDLQLRFVGAESTLFRVRYGGASSQERDDLLRSRDFNLIQVSHDEYRALKDELSAVFSRKGEPDSDNYYKVRWMRVPDLIARRRVFLLKGWAYLPAKDLSNVIFEEFEERLRKGLQMTAQALPRLEEDDRLVPLLDNLSQGFIAGASFGWDAGTTDKGDAITADMVERLSKKHFPLCMRSFQENLTRDGLLKHIGRLQYGLFLKVLGLSIEEAIIFWRKSFNRMTDDKFNKEYRYNIRHSYGLEGRRANYPARSCVQMLAPGESNQGCPYRNFSQENLRTALVSHYSALGLRAADLPEVMKLVEGNHFHLACTRVFEITHASVGVKKGDGIGKGDSVVHPNQYAARSIELEKEQDVDRMVE